MTTAQLSKRDQDEIRRSAEEARHAVIRPADVERYLRPASDTPYPLECALHLLGDIRERLVLDLGCGSGQNILPSSWPWRARGKMWARERI